MILDTKKADQILCQKITINKTTKMEINLNKEEEEMLLWMN